MRERPKLPRSPVPPSTAADPFNKRSFCGALRVAPLGFASCSIRPIDKIPWEMAFARSFTYIAERAAQSSLRNVIVKSVAA